MSQLENVLLELEKSNNIPEGYIQSDSKVIKHHILDHNTQGKQSRKIYLYFLCIVVESLQKFPFLFIEVKSSYAY